METKLQSALADRELSLMRGGPFYRAQLAAKVIRPNEWNHVRRITLAIVVGWLPVILLTVIFNPDSLGSVLTDYRLHSRMLIAVPVLLVGQFFMESRIRMIVAHIFDADLLEAPDQARMHSIIAMVRRARDSVLPELMVLFLLVIHTVTSFKGLVDATPWLAHGVKPDLHLTPAGWYAALVSTSVFQFLLGLSLWKWLLWTFFAFKVSRLNIKLVPAHPDGHGGLGFLGLTPVAFAPVAFAATTVIGATWRHEILHDGVGLMTFKLPAIALVVIVALVALGPLVFFVPRLSALRRQGIMEYGIIGQIQSTEFHEKWIHHRSGHEAEFLTAPESSTLSNFRTSYEKIAQLRPFAADRGAFIALALAVAVPILPVILAVIPLAVVLKTLFKALH